MDVYCIRNCTRIRLHKIQNDKMHNIIDLICCNSFLYHVWRIKNKLYINIYSSQTKIVSLCMSCLKLEIIYVDSLDISSIIDQSFDKSERSGLPKDFQSCLD